MGCRDGSDEAETPSGARRDLARMKAKEKMMLKCVMMMTMLGGLLMRPVVTQDVPEGYVDAKTYVQQAEKLAEQGKGNFDDPAVFLTTTLAFKCNGWVSSFTDSSVHTQRPRIFLRLTELTPEWGDEGQQSFSFKADLKLSIDTWEKEWINLEEKIGIKNMFHSYDEEQKARGRLQRFLDAQNIIFVTEHKAGTTISYKGTIVRIRNLVDKKVGWKVKHYLAPNFAFVKPTWKYKAEYPETTFYVIDSKEYTEYLQTLKDYLVQKTNEDKEIKAKLTRSKLK